MIIDGLQINHWTREVVDEVREGGVDIVHATCGVWEDTAGTLTRIGALRHFVRNNSDAVRIVRTVDDMHQATADGVLGLLLGFQNASMLNDDPELASMFSEIGVKVIQLTYNVQNHLGGSCYEPEDSGLTRVGHRMVGALNDAGVLIDISHVGNRTGRDAIAASAKPISATHANPTWFVDHPRNKPDELIAELTERGGILGVTMYPLISGGADISREAYCQMVATLADRFGVSNVAVGTDAVMGHPSDALGWMRSGRWDRPNQPEEVPALPEWASWFRGPIDFPSFAEGLTEVGFSDDERNAILGDNWLRLFAEVIG